MVMESDGPLRKLLTANAYAVGNDEFLKEVERNLKSRRKGDRRDGDVDLPAERVPLESIDRAVAVAYSVPEMRLKAHGHVAGEAKIVALELAARLSGKTQRQIGEHYGGIGSSAVAMMRRKIRADARLENKVEELKHALES